MNDEQPMTKEEALINHFNNVSPKELLEDISGGNPASGMEMKLVNEVMAHHNLPTPVMNVLIHYVLLQSNMKLDRNFIGKVAAHWGRLNFKTAEEVMAFARKEKRKSEYYRQAKAARESDTCTGS